MIRHRIHTHQQAPAQMKLTERQLATVLAALRHWQHRYAPHGDAPAHVAHLIAEAGEPLSVEEIDALCEELNA